MLLWLIIVVAISKKDMDIEELIDYIDTEKLNKYEHWNTLTNIKHRNYLKAIASK